MNCDWSLSDDFFFAESMREEDFDDSTAAAIWVEIRRKSAIVRKHKAEIKRLEAVVSTNGPVHVAYELGQRGCFHVIPANVFKLLDFLAEPVCWCPEGSPARLAATEFDEVEEKTEEMPLRLNTVGFDSKVQGQVVLSSGTPTQVFPAQRDDLLFWSRKIQVNIETLRQQEQLITEPFCLGDHYWRLLVTVKPYKTGPGSSQASDLSVFLCSDEILLSPECERKSPLYPNKLPKIRNRRQKRHHIVGHFGFEVTVDDQSKVYRLWYDEQRQPRPPSDVRGLGAVWIFDSSCYGGWGSDLNCLLDDSDTTLSVHVRLMTMKDLVEKAFKV